MELSYSCHRISLSSLCGYNVSRFVGRWLVKEEACEHPTTHRYRGQLRVTRTPASRIMPLVFLKPSRRRVRSHQASATLAYIHIIVLPALIGQVVQIGGGRYLLSPVVCTAHQP